MPELRTRARNRYETEYKANFRTPDLQQAYSPPKLRPRGFEELLQREAVRLPQRDDSPHRAEQAAGSSPGDKRQRGLYYRPLALAEHDRANNNNVPRPRPSGEEQRGFTEKPLSDRALRYKAGQALQMPRPIKQNFVSEYQRQFNWKNLPNQESPMLSADKMVFQSQAEVPAPTRNIKMPLKTEYQVQFSEFPTFEHRRTDRQKAAAAGENEQRPARTKIVKESRPPKDEPLMIYPAHNGPAVHSEYLSNFQPPSKYRYVKGAWLGAAPPHLMPSGDTLEEKGTSAVKHDAWYQQVLELRQRACSYKERALGGSEFLQVLRKLGDEQSKILKRAQENSVSPSNRVNHAAETRVVVPHAAEAGFNRRYSGEVGSNRCPSEDLGSNRRHSEDLVSNHRHSEDSDEDVSITQSDNQSDGSF